MPFLMMYLDSCQKLIVLTSTVTRNFSMEYKRSIESSLHHRKKLRSAIRSLSQDTKLNNYIRRHHGIQISSIRKQFIAVVQKIRRNVRDKFDRAALDGDSVLSSMTMSGMCLLLFHSHFDKDLYILRLHNS